MSGSQPFLLRDPEMVRNLFRDPNLILTATPMFFHATLFGVATPGLGTAALDPGCGPEGTAEGGKAREVGGSFVALLTAHH